MPKKCCVGGCSSNYKKEEEYTKVFRFPSDAQEKQCWIDKLPNILNTITGDPVLCEKHWPSGYETYKKKGLCTLFIHLPYFSYPRHSNDKIQLHPATLNRVTSMRNLDAEQVKKEILFSILTVLFLGKI